jgi:hypothetical protein
MIGIVAQKSRPSSQFVRLIAEVIRDNPGEFVPNSVITDKIVKLLDGDALAVLLDALAHAQPPVMTRDLHSQLNARPSSALTQCAMFSLLPRQLYGEFAQAFEYFVDNVTYATATFWVAWLKCRPFYTIAERLAINRDVRKLPVAHIAEIADAFIAALESRPSALLRYCWRQLLNHTGIADRVIGDAIGRFGQHGVRISEVFEEIFHPALFTASEGQCEALGNVLCTSQQLPRFQGIAFAIIGDRFRRSLDAPFVAGMALHLLELIQAVYEQEPSDALFLIDCYNSIVARVARASRDTFFGQMRPVFENLPDPIMELLVLHQPPQALREIDPVPLYGEAAQAPVPDDSADSPEASRQNSTDRGGASRTDEVVESDEMNIVLAGLFGGM